MTKKLQPNHNASEQKNHRLAVALKLVAIVAVVVAFYFQDLSLVFNDALGDEATYHILAIPFLFAYLLYRKRSMAAAAIKHKGANVALFFAKNFSLIIGVLLVLASVLTYWYGSYTFTPIIYHMLTLPVFTAGLILILFDMQTLKQLAFPVAFLFFLTPAPTEILFTAGTTLSDISAHASNAIVSAFGVATEISSQYGSPIITITRPDQTIMTFSIDVACSGVYSLIGFIIFATFIAYITRGKLWSKLIILIAGIPLIILLNIIRISTILAIGNSFGDALALQVFHTFGATVLMFIGTLILLVATEKLVKKPKPLEPCPTCKPGFTEEFCQNCGKIYNQQKTKLTRADITKIAGILIAIVMLVSIQAPVFALTEGPAQIITQTASGIQINTQTYPFPQIPGYNLSYIYRDTAFEETARQDASLVYAYAPSNTSKPTVWVTLEIAQTTGSLHRWETCLINYPLSQGLKPRVNQLDLRDIQIQENPPITARIFAFQYTTTNRTQAVVYWYTTATFSSENGTQTKQVKISIVTYPKSASQVEEYEAQMLPVAESICNYWEPTKTWTTIALVLSQNGLALSAAAIALIVALIIYRLFLYLQEKQSLNILYGKLPKINKDLVVAVKRAQAHVNPATEGIALELERLTGKPVDREWLLEKLYEAENAGLISKALVGREDKPVYVWRSQLFEAGKLLKVFHINL